MVNITAEGLHPTLDLLAQNAELTAIYTRFSDYLTARDKSDNTVGTYTRLLRQFFLWLDKDPTRIAPEDLERFRIYMRRNFTQNSIIGFSVAINHYLRMTDRGHMELKIPSKQRKNTVPLTPEEIQEIFKQSKNNPMDHALMVTLYYGALRSSELLNLNVQDIDFERSKIRVNSGKGARYDEIELHPTAATVLREYIDKHRAKPKTDKNALFVSSEGERLSRTPLWSRVKLYGAKAGIKKRIYPHLFRHSLLTHMAEGGASAFELQRQSRHKQLEQLIIYVHINGEKSRETFLRTAPNFDQQTVFKTPGENMVTTVKDREMALLDALLSGKISEDTYKKALDTLKSTEPTPAN